MWTSYSGKGGEGFHCEMDQSNDACYMQPTEHLMVKFQRNLYAVHLWYARILMILYEDYQG